MLVYVSLFIFESLLLLHLFYYFIIYNQHSVSYNPFIHSFIYLSIFMHSHSISENRLFDTFNRFLNLFAALCCICTLIEYRLNETDELAEKERKKKSEMNNNIKRFFSFFRFDRKRLFFIKSNVYLFICWVSCFAFTLSPIRIANRMLIEREYGVSIKNKYHLIAFSPQLFRFWFYYIQFCLRFPLSLSPSYHHYFCSKRNANGRQYSE